MYNATLKSQVRSVSPPHPLDARLRAGRARGSRRRSPKAFAGRGYRPTTNRPGAKGSHRAPKAATGRQWLPTPPPAEVMDGEKRRRSLGARALVRGQATAPPYRRQKAANPPPAPKAATDRLLRVEFGWACILFRVEFQQASAAGPAPLFRREGRPPGAVQSARAKKRSGRSAPRSAAGSQAVASVRYPRALRVPLAL